MYKLLLPSGKTITYDGVTWVTHSSELTNFLNDFMQDDPFDYEYREFPEFDKIERAAAMLRAEIVGDITEAEAPTGRDVVF